MIVHAYTVFTRVAEPEPGAASFFLPGGRSRHQNDMAPFQNWCTHCLKKMQTNIEKFCAINCIFIAVRRHTCSGMCEFLRVLLLRLMK
jgi:hypothetical protein